LNFIGKIAYAIFKRAMGVMSRKKSMNADNIQNNGGKLTK
jgi:hypothetical protein